MKLTLLVSDAIETVVFVCRLLICGIDFEKELSKAVKTVTDIICGSGSLAFLSSNYSAIIGFSNCIYI